jgi:hypothetical protein
MTVRKMMVSFALMGMIGSASAKEDNPRFDIILLIGQSNMAGQGKVEPQDRRAIPGVFKLTSNAQWAPAKDPLGSDDPREFGVGPGRSFARPLLKARPDARIGLVSAAVGNTNLQQWAPGGRLYNRAFLLLRQAQRTGRLRAILWHQGESDANNPRRAKSYAARWVAMMKQLRTDADAEHVPIIVGELGEYLDKPYASEINRQIESLPQKLDNVAVVSSKGLTERGDGLHFDSKSQRELGRRYAEAFMALDHSWVQEQ